MGIKRICEICGVREKQRGGFFANFPLDENRCRTWVKLVGTEDLVHLPIEKLHSLKHICGDHFEKKYLTAKRLKKTAIPTLKLTAVPLTDEQLQDFPLHVASKKTEVGPVPSTSEHSVFDMQKAKIEIEPGPATSGYSEFDMQITNESSPKKHDEETVRVRKNIPLPVDTDITPREKKLMQQLNKTKCSLASLKKSAKLIENLESDVLKAVVLDALKNQARNSKGQRWSSKNKISALAIFKRSPKTYKYLSSLIPLPSVKTLQNLLTKIPVTTVNNQAVLNH